ncbi:MAG: rhomboid family intramembrane serine protease [Gemmatimonadales bacterium]|jgi:membrane associated rhomboid family serine protease|nr:rhomboid family intramembrane serine protease [Gemmatimonadales bacterium]
MRTAPERPATRPSEVDAARSDLVRYLRRATRTVGGAIALIWGVSAVNLVLFAGSLNAFGILPRTMRGLPGIFLSPLLHTGIFHLLSNSVGLLLLGGLVILREERHFWFVTVTAALLGGLGVWAFGRPVVHIGISGVIFGYLGYLLLTGWFERKFGSIALSIVAFLLWAPMLLGMLPLQIGVSWESHVFGFLSGALAAWWLARRAARTAISR